MTEETIEETPTGDILVSQIQATPEPIKTDLALMLRRITQKMDTDEYNLNAGQMQLDRICSQLTDKQWLTLAETQIRIIAVRNEDAKNFILNNFEI